MTSKTDKEMKGCGKKFNINRFCGYTIVPSTREKILCSECREKKAKQEGIKEGRQEEREEMINELMTELYALFKRQEDDVSLYDIQVLLYEKIQERIKKINKKEEENDN